MAGKMGFVHKFDHLFHVLICDFVSCQSDSEIFDTQIFNRNNDITHVQSPQIVIYYSATP